MGTIDEFAEIPQDCTGKPILLCYKDRNMYGILKMEYPNGTSRRRMMLTIEKLENGIQVVLEEIGYVRSISFGIWVKNGTRKQHPEENGISHYIEHMMFKGTENRSARQIAEEMDALGGQDQRLYHKRIYLLSYPCAGQACETGHGSYERYAPSSGFFAGRSGCNETSLQKKSICMMMRRTGS